MQFAILLTIVMLQGAMAATRNTACQIHKAVFARCPKTTTCTRTTTTTASVTLSTPNPNAPIYSSDFSAMGYFQPETNPQYIRNATCTWYNGCSSQKNAFGLQPVSGYTAALSQFSFGAVSGYG